MICPDCRRKPWYWADLSRPNEGNLTYVCQHCKMLILRAKCDDPEMVAKVLGIRGGVRLLTLKLAERYYTLPPSDKRHPVKQAPSRKTKEPAYPSRGGDT